MIRSSTIITRSTIAAAGSILSPAKVRQLNYSSNSIKARSFNTHRHPLPYHGEPVGGSFQVDPSPRHYANRLGHQVNPNFGQFHPGVNWRDPRLGFQFRGEYGPYPVGLFCRFCGCQQFVPVSYGGNWAWNPNVGGFRYGVVPGNGFVDPGIGYDRGGWPQMRNDYIRNNAGGSFDGRSSGHENLNRSYGENVSNFMRSPNEGWVRDSNINQNVGRQMEDFSDNSYERRGGHQVNGVEEGKIAHNGYRRPQDGYRWRNDNFIGNDGREERDPNVWSQSRSSYNGHGPEHHVHQGNEYGNQKNGNTGWDQMRLGYSGRSGGGQPRNLTVDERQMNSNEVSRGFQLYRQSPWISDVRRNDSNHGSDERNWSAGLQSSSDYNRPWVRGSNGHENLNMPYGESLNGFQRNTNMSHGQNLTVDPTGGQYQKSFNAASNGEAGRLFQEKVVKHDSVNVGYEQEARAMRNLYDPLPEFAENEQPANQNRTNAQNNQMPNMNDKGVDNNNVRHGSKDAAGRCQRIIDVLENEDNHKPKDPNRRFISQPKNEYTNNPAGIVANCNSKVHDGKSYNENGLFGSNSNAVQPNGTAYYG